MSRPSQVNVANVLQTCQQQSAALADSLNRCFERTFRLSVGEPATWAEESPPVEFHGPGLVASLGPVGEGMLCLIPEVLLPIWYANPDDGEKARLEALAKEWSGHLVPTDPDAELVSPSSAENLKNAVDSAGLTGTRMALPLAVYEGETESDEPAKPIANVYLLFSVDEPPASTDAERPSAPSASAASSGEAGDAPATSALPNRGSRHRHPACTKHLLQLPVIVSVRLGERKMELSQLLSLTPGSLISFNKSCEEFLDLYVNDSLYCRGEAVKIGEKFGIKISEVGAVTTRSPKILES